MKIPPYDIHKTEKQTHIYTFIHNKIYFILFYVMSSKSHAIYLSLLSQSFSDHHLRCGGWLNLEFSKREKHSGWAIKTIYKK